MRFLLSFHAVQGRAFCPWVDAGKFASRSRTWQVVMADSAGEAGSVSGATLCLRWRAAPV
jgi:hypothetical protein